MGIYACPVCGNPNGWWSGNMRDVHDCPGPPRRQWPQRPGYPPQLDWSEVDDPRAEPAASGADHNGAPTVNGEATPARGAAECTEPSSSMGTPGAAPLPGVSEDEKRLDWMEEFYARTAYVSREWNNFMSEAAALGFRAAIDAAILASAASPAGGTQPQRCLHDRVVVQTMGDGSTVDYCSDCGRNVGWHAAPGTLISSGGENAPGDKGDAT